MKFRNFLIYSFFIFSITACESELTTITNDDSALTKNLRTAQTSNNGNLQTTDYDFEFSIYESLSGGCTFNYYDLEDGWGTSDNFYGPVPAVWDDGTTIYGYGAPFHDPNYNSLVLDAANLKTTVSFNGNNYNSYISRGSAIAIEYDFEPNYSYEIELTTKLLDYLKFTNNINSNFFPMVYAELRDSGVIQGNDPCGGSPMNTILNSTIYTRQHIFTDVEQIRQERIIYHFNFSPTEAKNAFVISIHPTWTIRNHDPMKNVSNWFLMLPHIKIIKKAFNPWHNIDGDPQRTYITYKGDNAPKYVPPRSTIYIQGDRDFYNMGDPENPVPRAGVKDGSPRQSGWRPGGRN